MNGGTQTLVYDLGTYQLSLTGTQADQINEDSQRYLQDNINNNTNKIVSKMDEVVSAQQETTQAVEDNTRAVEHLENTITDSNVDDSSINLPQDSSNDITRDGLNGIFTSFYNAFCTGTAQDIVFPIPFTNKSITLQPNYVRSMLSNYGGSWIITLIEAFWWFLISRYIIKDIASKINKIKSGDIESVETSNIKGDML